jgi:hypothetical protein
VTEDEPARLPAGTSRTGNAVARRGDLVVICQLCRRRHNRHYAELLVMPSRWWGLRAPAAYECMAR